LFLNEISDPGDLILTLGQPQVEYYSERGTENPKVWAEADPNDEGHFESTLKKIREEENMRFILISFSEPGYPGWMRAMQGINGQVSTWEIPFMDTKIDFSTGERDIKQEKSYEDITFRLRDIKQEIFVYEIIRT